MEEGSRREAMAARKKTKKLRQLTIEQSICSRTNIVGSAPIEEGDEPGKSGESCSAWISPRVSPQPSDSPERQPCDSSESSGSDEFSEPDPDSSDEWLPSGSCSTSSRASSPEHDRGKS